ncbi:hypothetical protein BJ875DRAFT_387891 [Amylocarpus encephaloides]|uniref:Inner centromere protein ARK-binding domain-containing protein n=1 Tax=Amylocarpus encephaloides TaxID=45428 RepID=A0A9P7Y866_9HELO|nr:hypothetical protein BJ875DRAFT_387891 [Amylocarpus encephaloides]
MATTRQNRLQVGSGSWVLEERKSALQIAGTEAEEFSFSARNELEWLNEHMADIFNENHVSVAEIFKTPGKLRGKTPRTVRKANPLETRPPLSDVFSVTPRGLPSPFRQAQFERPVATFQVAEDESSEPEQPAVQQPAPKDSPIHRKPVPNYFDSGYFGSQSQNTHATQAIEVADTQATIPYSQPEVASPQPALVQDEQIMERDSGGSFQSAKEELSRSVPDTEGMDIDTENVQPIIELEASVHPVLESPFQTRPQQSPSPKKRFQQSPQRSPDHYSNHPQQILSSPQKSSPQRIAPQSPQRSPQHLQERPVADLRSSPPTVAKIDSVEEAGSFIVNEQMEDLQSPSDSSSPIRPIVRKSSLNFASLPAREPLTSKKSLGERISRSHLEQTRTSYYGRTTGGKSLGNSHQEEHGADEDEMDIDMDDEDTIIQEPDSKIARLHNKTSTQRLQDQISMLGQSQSHARPASKSIAGNGLPISQSSQISSAAPLVETTQRQKSPQRSPDRKSRPPPGAFPEDEEDSWIGRPTVPQNGASVFSPRPQLPKSHTADVMEGIHNKDSIAGPQFNIPKRGENQRQRSPICEPVIPERTTSTLGQLKSVSTSVLRSPKKVDEAPLFQKAISVSNPNPSTSSNGAQTTPPKSPSRSYRGSPLKAAKDKFSSILKTSRGLFASSAAVSAEAKTSALSPPSTRPGMHQGPSFEDVLSQANDKAPLYPILDNESSEQVDSVQRAASPPKTNGRKTRASTEREERRKEEEAREARGVKEAQRMESQLEKARSKVKEEARVFHKRQERVVAMQKEVEARKELEKQAKASQVDLPRATRSSPRKIKAQLEAQGFAAVASTDDVSNRDVEMADVSAMPPPAAIPRPKSQIGRPGPKRPLRPAKNTLARPQPPTVIRVDTGSQRGHQYHPSTSTLSATLQESLSAPSGPGLRKKASTSSIQSKASTSSFKATANKALEAAARKKEQDEMVAQRKREAKQEIERQRAALKEEERRKEELQRRQEAERQRERERAAVAADAKKAASRQAAEKRRQELEKAKQTRAPPPAAHHLQDKALPPIPRGEHNQAKPNRNDMNAHRQHDELAKAPSQPSHNITKFAPKRPLQEESDDHARPALQRNGPSYQTEGHSKRRKTSERFDDDELMENQPTINAPPIRRTSSKPKEMQPKSLFPSGYTNAPSSNNLQRSTIMSQHNLNQSKPAHPMDMAQISKGPIAFAPNPNQPKPHQHKTPMRPADIKPNAKSAAKSSPQYQNGENIDLPEIMTDSDDDDDEEGPGKPSFTAPWVESPALRKQLTEQENIDPNEIFGQPGPINMEEVFNKSKDKFKNFRSRTSSANWGGIDRLTEDEIKKDLAARQRMQRVGGWEYSSMI